MVDPSITHIIRHLDFARHNKFAAASSGGRGGSILILFVNHVQFTVPAGGHFR